MILRRCLAVLILVLAGCQHRPPLAPGAPLNQAGPTELGQPSGTPRLSGAVGSSENNPPAVASYGSGAGVRPTARRTAATTGQGEFTLNFVDADIREIAGTILGDMMRVNYAIDPAARGTGTIKTVKPLKRSELLPVLQTLLSQNGLTLVVDNGIYRVLPMATSSGSAILGSGAGAGSAGAEIVPLRYASAKDLATMLEPFVSEGGKIAADPTRNVLVVSGDPAGRSALIELIRTFDTDFLARQSYVVFPVTGGDPAKVATELETALGVAEGGPVAGIVRVVPLEHVNAVLVVGSQPRYIEDARRLFSVIDRAKSATARTWHVYYVQNGQSSDLEYVLQRAFTPGHVSLSQAPGQTVPGLDQAGMNSSSSSGTSGGGGGGIGQSIGTNSTSGASANNSGTDQNGPSPSDTNQPSPESPAAEPLSATTGGENGAASINTIRIIANRANNALLIYATPEEYGTIDAMLRKIDILPLQVRIDATIAEVTLNDTLRYGTQFFFKSGGLQGFLSDVQAGTVAGEFPGFVLSRGTGSVRFAISALQAVTNVRVLSSPQVLVLDNQPARLQVGDLVPFITQSSQSTINNNSPVINSIDYRETGVILQVLPRVNSGGLVSLDIAQEVSDVRTTTSSNIDSPTFLERKVRSRVVVQDGETVGLAGLIRDNTSVGNSGIPFLKDVPLLGSLFSLQNNTRVRTELLVLITPHVVHDQRGARALTQDLQQTLGNASLVPAQLQAKPLSGSTDPNAEYFNR